MAEGQGMTEAEWKKCTALWEMVWFVRNTGSPRQLRLFACACCRSAWDDLPAECSRRGVEVGEQFADRLATSQEREQALEAIQIMKEEAVAAHEFYVAAALRDSQSPVAGNMKENL